LEKSFRPLVVVEIPQLLADIEIIDFEELPKLSQLVEPVRECDIQLKKV
jgi:hypothetical protein